MNGIKNALSQVPGWARIALILVPLVAAASSANVEFQLHEAIEEIPDGEEHDKAWKMFHRIRQFNRATLGVSAVAAIAFGIGFLLARKSDAERGSSSIS